MFFSDVLLEKIILMLFMDYVEIENQLQHFTYKPISLNNNY